MQVQNHGKVTKCMNPEIDCLNHLDPASAYVVVYQGKPLVLCKSCGPEFQLKKIQEGMSKIERAGEG
jgi:hypothetical protein